MAKQPSPLFHLFHNNLVEIDPSILAFLEITFGALAGIGEFNFHITSRSRQIVEYGIFDGCTGTEHFVMRISFCCKRLERLVVTDTDSFISDGMYTPMLELLMQPSTMRFIDVRLPRSRTNEPSLAYQPAHSKSEWRSLPRRPLVST